jgi:hypothetical protein
MDVFHLQWPNKVLFCPPANDVLSESRCSLLDLLWSVAVLARTEHTQTHFFAKNCIVLYTLFRSCELFFMDVISIVVNQLYLRSCFRNVLLIIYSVKRGCYFHNGYIQSLFLLSSCPSREQLHCVIYSPQILLTRFTPFPFFNRLWSPPHNDWCVR